MYVYIKSKGEDIWTVGFFGPDGLWHAETDYKTWKEAATRVHFLNGGNDATHHS